MVLVPLSLSQSAFHDAFVVTVSKERIAVFLSYRSRLSVFSRELRCTQVFDWAGTKASDAVSASSALPSRTLVLATS